MAENKNLEVQKEKKFRKSININIDFADLGNDIYRSVVEIKTFDLKDEIKEMGFIFEGKNSDQIRNGAVQKQFTQKKEIYMPKDLANLRKICLNEVLTILRSFEKTIAVEPNASQNNATTQKP